MDTIEERARQFADEHVLGESTDPQLREVIYLFYIAAARAERNLVFSRLTELFPEDFVIQKPREKTKTS